MTLLHPDRLFPADPTTRSIARSLYSEVANLPIVSPHGHTDPSWWGENIGFADAAELLVIPDHYIVRMLVSQGVPFEALGIGSGAETDRRAIWRTFAAHYHLFLGTPSRLWTDYVFSRVFDIHTRLTAKNADQFYDAINTCLAQPEYRPRALYDKFNIDVITTTDSALDDLSHHQSVQNSDWQARILPTYRPDAVVDPEAADFRENIDCLGEITGADVYTWQGYLEAHRMRRQFFISMGARATDHGHPTARTANLSEMDAESLFQKVLKGRNHPEDAELFRAQMLTEMARMSIDDGLVMQLHAGSHRNHSPHILKTYGPNKGFDFPHRTGYVDELKPLLTEFGLNPALRIILFTLDESTYARELAPLCGAYPSLKLGPAWWFHDSFEGMRRYRQMVTETAGFSNTVGFNDDTRALCSIPARHDVSRRVDCSYLAELVTSHRLAEDEAFTLAPQLAGDLARDAYKF